LRFIPKFKTQLQAVTDAQKSIGRDISEGSLWHRTKIAITVLSIMVTWALENAIETADSMKSRGYGLKGRTAFSIYRFDDRDKMALLFLGFCGLYLLSGSMADAFGQHWQNLAFGCLSTSVHLPAPSPMKRQIPFSRYSAKLSSSMIIGEVSVIWLPFSKTAV
jgi:hypothetical protein